MELKDKIDSDCKTALKSGEKLKVSTLRMILAEVKNAEIAKRGNLSEEELLAVVTREAKKRNESIEEFGKGGREDLVAKESEELAIIQAYLPEQMSDDEVRSILEETIKEVGATSTGDLGKVMAKLMPKIKGKADGKKVNQMVREMLQS
jgi:uncharacterized protein YqeY